jgi:chromosome segregation ATPase
MSNGAESPSESTVSTTVTWMLKAVVRVLIIAISLAALVLIIQFGLQQYNRRFNNVNSRIDLLHDDMDQLLKNKREQQDQLGELQGDIEEQRRLSATRSAAFEERMAQQEDLLADLESASAGFIVSGETFSQSVTVLGEEVDVLAGGFDDQTGQITFLSDDIELLQTRISSQGSQIGDLETIITTPDEESARLLRTLTLFHTWELVARARLRLAEANAGLAAIDVERALEIVTVLVDQSDETTLEALEGIQVRLALALDALPDSPTAASRDLEEAWDQLDRLLTLLLLPEIALKADEASGPAEATTPTPTGAAEQAATASPPATPSPTPSQP